MVGFGFVDNLIMVVAGDSIDKSLGIMFGFSAMCAAGNFATFFLMQFQKQSLMQKDHVSVELCTFFVSLDGSARKLCAIIIRFGKRMF